jgi:hypothetical protein
LKQIFPRPGLTHVKAKRGASSDNAEKTGGDYMLRYIPVLLFLGAFPMTAHAFKCNVCHSKNPAMVRMHRAVQEKEIGCFDCHRIGEKLMGKAQAKDRESLLRRRETEDSCRGCHIKN